MCRESWKEPLGKTAEGFIESYWPESHTEPCMLSIEHKYAQKPMANVQTILIRIYIFYYLEFEFISVTNQYMKLFTLKIIKINIKSLLAQLFCSSPSPEEATIMIWVWVLQSQKNFFLLR